MKPNQLDVRPSAFMLEAVKRLPQKIRKPSSIVKEVEPLTSTPQPITLKNQAISKYVCDCCYCKVLDFKKSDRQ